MKPTTQFEQSPFPPLRLAASDRARLERLAHDLLHQALDDYERIGLPPQRMLPKTTWKPFKSVENCTVFAPASKAKSSKALSTNTTNAAALSAFDPHNILSSSDASVSTADNDHEASCAPSHHRSNLSDLVLSGTVAGSLEDVLYGMIACDSADMIVRSTYTTDALLDGAVLLALHLPSQRSPFTFLGIKWTVRDVPSSATSYRKHTPRDFVYLEATGVTTRRDGVRIGYVLRHPLELTTCGTLSVTRGRVSLAALYTPLANNHSVDVYARGHVDLGSGGSSSSKPSASTTQTATAAMLLASATTAVVCAQSKKLAWLLVEQQRLGGAADPTLPVVRADMFCCGTCSKKFGKLRSVGTCRICCVQMCSRCRMLRSLVVVKDPLMLAIESVAGVFCKNCIAFANQTDAMDVATADVTRGRFGVVAVDDDDTAHHAATTAQSSVSSSQSSGLSCAARTAASLASGASSTNHSRRVVGSTPSTPTATPPSSTRSYDQQDTLSALPPPPLPAASTASCSSTTTTTAAAAAPVSFDSSRTTDWSRDSSASSFCGSDNDNSSSNDVVVVVDEAIDSVGIVAHSGRHPQSMRSYPDQNQNQNQNPYAANPDRQELWRKMTELRLQAESVYQLTKKNASMHMVQHNNYANGGASGSDSGYYDSDVEAID